MGNGNFTPSNYDETQMHEDFYTQSYKGGGSDNIPMGDGTISLGAKILQDTSNSELYVTDRAGKRWYLTEHGKPVPNVAARVKLAANYKSGPAVMITGPPSHPTYTMFHGSDEDTGTMFHPLVVNNYSDLYTAVKGGHNRYQGKAKDSSLGDAAVNPFMKRPRDVWSAVADENRAIASVGADIVVPVAEAVLDEFVPFSSSILNATGLTDLMQNGLREALAAGYLHEDYKSSTPFYPPMSNVITDPRLTKSVEASRQDAHIWSIKTRDVALGGILAEQPKTPQEQVAFLGKVQERTKQLFALQTKRLMEHNLSELKRVGYDTAELEGGIEGAQTADQILRVAKFVNQRVIKDIVPGLDDSQKHTLLTTASATTPDKSMRVAKESITVAVGGETRAHPVVAGDIGPRVINGNRSYNRYARGDIAG